MLATPTPCSLWALWLKNGIRVRRGCEFLVAGANSRCCGFQPQRDSLSIMRRLEATATLILRRGGKPNDLHVK